MEIKKTYKKFHKQRRFFMKVLKETIKKGVNLVAAAGLMAGLALAMPYNVNTVQAATVSNVEITIPELVAGKAFSSEVTGGEEQFTGTIAWKLDEEEAGEIVECEKAYTATVTLTASSEEYIFPNGEISVSVNGDSIQNVTVEDAEGASTITFDVLFGETEHVLENGICDACETIMVVECTFDSPEHGKDLATEATLTQAEAGVEVDEITWTVDTVDGEEATGKAKCNTTYVAKITFRAKDGYEWLADRVTFGDDEIALVAGENDKEKIAVVTFDATEGHEDNDENDVCDYCELPKVKIVELTIAEPKGESELATELTDLTNIPDGVTVKEISWNVAAGTKATCNTEYAVSISLELDQKTNYFAENNEITFKLNNKVIGGSSSVDGYTSSWKLSTAMTTPDHTDKEEPNDACDYCGMTKVSKIEVTIDPLVAVTGSLPKKVTMDDNIVKYVSNDLLLWYEKEITDVSGEYTTSGRGSSVECGKQYYLRTSPITLTNSTSYYWDNENEVVATVNDEKATIEWQNDGSFIIQSAPICMYHKAADSNGVCGRKGCNTIRNINIEVTLTPGEPLGTPVLNDTVSQFTTWY